VFRQGPGRFLSYSWFFVVREIFRDNVNLVVRVVVFAEVVVVVHVRHVRRTISHGFQGDVFIV